MRRERLREPVRVLEACGRRLVDHGHDVDPRAPEGFEGDETLSRMRVGGNADDGLEPAPDGLGGGADGFRDVREEPGDDVDERNREAAEFDLGVLVDVRARQQALEGAQVRSALEGQARGLETVDRTGIRQSDDRRDVLTGVRVPIWEREKRIVAAVGDGDGCARGSKVDSESHEAESTSSFGVDGGISQRRVAFCFGPF